MSREQVRSEDGIALIAAMFAVLVMSMLAVLFVSNAVSSSRQSGLEKNRENAIHLADAAADNVISIVNQPNGPNQGENYATTTVEPYPGGGDSTEAGWALEEALRTAASNLVPTGDGEAYAIRPVDPATGEPMDLIYSVGFSPNRSAVDPDGDLDVEDARRNARYRIVKMQISTGFFSPEDAILTCGDFELGGNAATDGINGNVFVNGDVTNDGIAFKINGTLTATGDVSDQITSPTQVSGTITENHVGKPCPMFSAMDLYTREDPDGKDGANPDRDASSPYYGRDEATGDPIFWYDLCPPGIGGETLGHIRQPSPSGPCDPAAPVEWREGDTSGSQGWDYKNVSGVRTWVGGFVRSGVFYVYERNARITGGDGAVTLIIDKGADDADNKDDGNFDMQGNPKLRSAVWDIQLLAERDATMQGTPGTEVHGMILVGEQARASGNVTMTGAMVIREEAHTAGSPIGTGGSHVKGSMQITNDGRFRSPVHDITRVTFWNEIRP